MGREDKQREREFSEYIDKMLAGEEVHAGEGMSEEFRAALDFARELIELRGQPSPSFRAELKKKLLQQMVEQEIRNAEEKRNWLRGFLSKLSPLSMAWRAATTAVIIIVLTFIGVYWYMGGFTGAPSPVTTTPAPTITVPAPTTPPPVTSAPVPVPPTTVVPTIPSPAPTTPSPTLPPVTTIISVELDMVPSQTIYKPGEEVGIELRLTNTSTEAVTITDMPPKLSLGQPGPEDALPRPEDDTFKVVYSFDAGTEERELAVGETATYKLTWDQKDETGQQAPSGWYFGDYEYTIRKETPPVHEFKSGGRDRLFLIQYPQGAMEKVIEPNQSQKVANLPFDVDGEVKLVDIVFTLKRVALSQDRASFLILVSSPNNPLPDYDNHNWQSMRMKAQYVIDGVIKNARASNRQFTEDGIEIRCGYNNSYLDPVPSDAKELKFVITSFGDWEGPWEFVVPLE